MHWFSIVTVVTLKQVEKGVHIVTTEDSDSPFLDFQVGSTKALSLLEYSQIGDTVVSGVVSEQSGHYSSPPRLISREKWARKDKLHHLTRIKKKNTLAASSQGWKANVSTIIYYQPSPGLTKETRSLTPNCVRGLMKDVPPLALK